MRSTDIWYRNPNLNLWARVTIDSDNVGLLLIDKPPGTNSVKFKRNFENFLKKDNAFQNVVCKQAPAFSRSQWLKTLLNNFSADANQIFIRMISHEHYGLKWRLNLAVCSTVGSGENHGNIKALHHWPFVTGIHLSRGIPFTKGRWCGALIFLW